MEDEMNTDENVMDTLADESGENMAASTTPTNFEIQRTAYIPLLKNGLLDKNTNEIVGAIAKENAKELHPLFALRQRRAFKLLFPTPEARDKAIEKKLSIFNLLVELEKPRTPDTKKKLTIHVYGIPIDEKADGIAKWLKDQELETVSEMRWMTYPNTEIRNGGRSFVVSKPENKEIRGFVPYITVQKRVVVAQIWYRGMPIWCRRCMSKGHMAKECRSMDEEQRRVQPDPNSYAAKASGISGTVPATTGNEDSSSQSEQTAAGSVDTVQMVSLNSGPSAVRRTVQLPPKQQRSVADSPKGENAFFPFYTWRSILSNHHPCTFTIGKTTYKSTEHFLFSEKAKKIGNKDAAKLIQDTSKAAEAKKLGQALIWDEVKHGDWIQFASERLRVANAKKYEQNDELRKYSFETAPKSLVEASPNDLRWGVGLDKDDPAIFDRANWKGQNLFGKLLTALRDDMMRSDKYKVEVGLIEEQRREEMNRNKRQHSSDDSDGEDGTDGRPVNPCKRSEAISILGKDMYGTAE